MTDFHLDDPSELSCVTAVDDSTEILNIIDNIRLILLRSDNNRALHIVYGSSGWLVSEQNHKHDTEPQTDRQRPTRTHTDTHTHTNQTYKQAVDEAARQQHQRSVDTTAEYVDYLQPSKLRRQAEYQLRMHSGRQNQPVTQPTLAHVTGRSAWPVIHGWTAGHAPPTTLWR